MWTCKTLACYIYGMSCENKQTQPTKINSWLMWKTHAVCLRALVGIPLKETIEEEVEKKKKQSTCYSRRGVIDGKFSH